MANTRRCHGRSTRGWWASVRLRISIEVDVVRIWTNPEHSLRSRVNGVSLRVWWTRANIGCDAPVGNGAVRLGLRLDKILATGTCPALGAVPCAHASVVDRFFFGLGRLVL